MPRTGDAYCGFWAKAFKPSNHYFEYLEAPLTTTLEAGKAYKVQFYVSLPGKFCAVSHLGAYFSVGALTVPGWETLPFTPQVESNTGFLSDTVNWMLIKGCFIAAGGESHIVIGNFRTFDDTPLDPFCSAPIDTQSYYFIEDVSVVPVQPTGFSFDLGGPVTECYQYTIAPGLSGVNYYWENGSTDSTLTVTTSGVYSLTVYDGCLGGVDSVEVNITNKPAIEFNPNSYSICEGSSLIVSLDPDEGTYLWQDGSASTYYIISTSGTYSVTLNDGCDLTFDTIGITVVEPPVPFSLGNDTILCTGTEIEFIFDPSLGAFMWQDSNTSPAVIITQGGLYALTISNVCGEVSDQVQVIELAIPVVSLGPPSDVLCNGDFIDISLDPDLGTYQWQDGSTALNYQINTTGMYSVTLTNTCGQANDSLEIITLAAPDFDLGDSLDACPGDTIILNANFAMSQYAWQDGSVNDSLMVTSSGMYALTVENVCGSHSDSVAIMYVQALSQPDLGPDVNLCPGEKVVFHTDAPGAEFLWNDLSTADSLVAIMAGIYFVHVTNYCSTYADTVVVTTTSAPPNLNLPADFALCQGQIVMLNSNVTGVNYLWSDGSSDAQLAVASPGMYACTISNACGVDVDSVLISDGGSAPTVSLGMDTSICEGTTLTLVPGSSGAAAWLWQDGSVDSVYQVSLAGEYHVECANNCGVAYDTMMISVLPAIPDLSFGPDTAICPNTFILLSINIPNVNIQWSDGSSDSIFVISDGGIVFASISNSCGMSADSLMISMLPAIPVLDLGEDQKICQGEMVTIDPNIPNVNYTWQDGSSDSQLLVTQGELVVLTIDNACGISTDS
ncbi:MAG: hypothetical protein ABIQ02_05770, partial [Saprospiraceae bacterium]